MRSRWINLLAFVFFVGAGEGWAIDHQRSLDPDQQRIRSAKDERPARPEAIADLYYCKEEGLSAKDIRRIKDTLDTFALPRDTSYLDDQLGMGHFIAEATGDSAVGFAFGALGSKTHSFAGQDMALQGVNKGQDSRLISMDAQMSKDKNTLVVTATMDIKETNDTRNIHYVRMTVTRLKNGLFQIHYSTATRPKVTSGQLGTCLGWGVGTAARMGLRVGASRFGLGGLDAGKENHGVLLKDGLRNEETCRGLIGPRETLEKIQEERKKK